MADNDTTNDVIGSRLSVLGAIGAVAVGVIWMAQRNSHDSGAEIFSAISDAEAFNNTPYAIAMAIALGVLVVGLVLRGSNR